MRSSDAVSSEVVRLCACLAVCVAGVMIWVTQRSLAYLQISRLVGWIARRRSLCPLVSLLRSRHVAIFVCCGFLGFWHVLDGVTILGHGAHR